MRLAPLVALALAPSLALALPITLPHYGRLLNDSGPVEGPVTIHFRLFPPKLQGQVETPTWEQQYTVNCAQGVYSVLLGDPEKGTPIESTSVDLAKPLFLAVQVENGPEMLPRLSVGHVLFAAQAFDAQKLGGKEPSYYARAADLESARSEAVSALAAYVTANDETINLRATKAELTALSGTVEQNKTTAASATSAVASNLAANYLKTSASDARYVLTPLPAVNVTIGATSARPGSPAAGAGFYDTTARTLQIHDGTAWQTVGGNSVIDCKLHRAAGLTTSGNYTVVTNGNAISTWCNMTLDGGGWTEVYHQGGDENSFGIGYKPNTQPIVAGSTEMLFAFADDATNTLSQAWKFATPAAFQNAAPMVAAPGPAPSGCGYVSIAATRLADSTVTTRILRYGSASFGNFCDQGCGGSWGQICLKSNSALGGGTVATDGFSDFPHFTGYVPSSGSFSNVTDNCSRSDQGYTTTACAASRHFVIYVR